MHNLSSYPSSPTEGQAQRSVATPGAPREGASRGYGCDDEEEWGSGAYGPRRAPMRPPSMNNLSPSAAAASAVAAMLPTVAPETATAALDVRANSSGPRSMHTRATQNDVTVTACETNEDFTRPSCTFVPTLADQCAAQVVDRLRWWRVQRIRDQPLPTEHFALNGSHTNYSSFGTRPLSRRLLRGLQRAAETVASARPLAALPMNPQEGSRWSTSVPVAGIGDGGALSSLAATTSSSPSAFVQAPSPPGANDGVIATVVTPEERDLATHKKPSTSPSCSPHRHRHRRHHHAEPDEGNGSNNHHRRCHCDPVGGNAADADGQQRRLRRGRTREAASGTSGHARTPADEAAALRRAATLLALYRPRAHSSPLPFRVVRRIPQESSAGPSSLLPSAPADSRRQQQQRQNRATNAMGDAADTAGVGMAPFSNRLMALTGSPVTQGGTLLQSLSDREPSPGPSTATPATMAAATMTTASLHAPSQLSLLSRSQQRKPSASHALLAAENTASGPHAIVLHNPPRLVVHSRHMPADKAVLTAKVTAMDVESSSFMTDRSEILGLTALPLRSYERDFYGRQLCDATLDDSGRLLSQERRQQRQQRQGSRASPHPRRRRLRAASVPALPFIVDVHALMREGGANKTTRMGKDNRYHNTVSSRGEKGTQSGRPPALTVTTACLTKVARNYPLANGSEHTCRRVEDLQEVYCFHPLIDCIGTGAFSQVYAALPILRGPDGQALFSSSMVVPSRIQDTSSATTVTKLSAASVANEGTSTMTTTITTAAAAAASTALSTAGTGETREVAASTCGDDTAIDTATRDASRMIHHSSAVRAVAIKVIARKPKKPRTGVAETEEDHRVIGGAPVAAAAAGGGGVGGAVPDASQRRELVEIEREISILRRLRHTGCSRFYEAVRTPDAFVISMMMSPGCMNARQFLARFGPPTELRAALMLFQLMETIHYLHYEFGLLHRDIKLENLLVSLIDAPVDRVQQLLGPDVNKADALQMACDGDRSDSSGKPFDNDWSHARVIGGVATVGGADVAGTTAAATAGAATGAGALSTAAGGAVRGGDPSHRERAASARGVATCKALGTAQVDSAAQMLRVTLIDFGLARRTRSAATAAATTPSAAGASGATPSPGSAGPLTASGMAPPTPSGSTTKHSSRGLTTTSAAGAVGSLMSAPGFPRSGSRGVMRVGKAMPSGANAGNGSSNSLTTSTSLAATHHAGGSGCGVRAMPQAVSRLGMPSPLPSTANMFMHYYGVEDADEEEEDFDEADTYDSNGGCRTGGGGGSGNSIESGRRNRGPTELIESDDEDANVEAASATDSSASEISWSADSDGDGDGDTHTGQSVAATHERVDIRAGVQQSPPPSPRDGARAFATPPLMSLSPAETSATNAPSAFAPLTGATSLSLSLGVPPLAQVRHRTMSSSVGGPTPVSTPVAGAGGLGSAATSTVPANGGCVHGIDRSTSGGAAVGAGATATFAHSLGRDDDEAAAMLLVTPCGTERYMPPEMLEWILAHGWARRPTTAALAMQMDMYAAGIVAYVLLSGCFPFNATSRATLLQQQRRVPRCNSIHWAGVSGAAISFVQGLLEPDPARRMTAQEALRHPFLSEAAGLAAKLGLVPRPYDAHGVPLARERSTGGGLCGATPRRTEHSPASAPVPLTGNEFSGARWSGGSVSLTPTHPAAHPAFQSSIGLVATSAAVATASVAGGRGVTGGSSASVYGGGRRASARMVGTPLSRSLDVYAAAYLDIVGAGMGGDPGGAGALLASPGGSVRSPGSAMTPAAQRRRSVSFRLDSPKEGTMATATTDAAAHPPRPAEDVSTAHVSGSAAPSVNVDDMSEAAQSVSTVYTVPTPAAADAATVSVPMALPPLPKPIVAEVAPVARNPQGFDNTAATDAAGVRSGGGRDLFDQLYNDMMGD